MITTDVDHDMAVDASTFDWLITGWRDLYVIGPSASDVVGRVGGWIVDLAMAGCTVMVFIAGLRDYRPLRILGAQLDQAGSALMPTGSYSGRVALAVAAGTLDNDEWVRRLVARKLDEGLCDLAIWGDTMSADLPARFAKTSYRASPAAMAFKKHAVIAATSVAAPDVEISEVFYTKRANRYTPK